MDKQELENSDWPQTSSVTVRHPEIDQEFRQLCSLLVSGENSEFRVKLIVNV